MSLEDSMQYAEWLRREYKCHITIENLNGTETVTSQVAKAVLPPWLLEKWLKDVKKENRRLREKYDLKPYDKFDHLTLDDIP